MVWLPAGSPSLGTFLLGTQPPCSEETITEQPHGEAPVEGNCGSQPTAPTKRRMHARTGFQMTPAPGVELRPQVSWSCAPCALLSNRTHRLVHGFATSQVWGNFLQSHSNRNSTLILQMLAFLSAEWE